MIDKDYIYYGDGEGSISTPEGKQRLLDEENIIYVGGTYAFKIIERKGMDRLIELWSEDDETLHKTKEQFSEAWLNHLEGLIVITQKYLKSK